MDKWLIKTTVRAGMSSGSAMQQCDDSLSISSPMELQNSPSTSTANPKRKECFKTDSRKHKIRKYDEEYLKFGFSWTMVNNEQRPICVLCSEVLANDSLKPVKLKRHLQTKHSEHVNKSVDFFRTREKAQNISQNNSIHKTIIKGSEGIF